ncbi:hypothetical protein [Thermococcus sp.]|uniref:hypothetical protein n=1 Tax=Thermococcus sp. TaxID=35749 RepID=UPI00260B3C31|nr:hypothetical protein [Thermococcus sp.]
MEPSPFTAGRRSDLHSLHPLEFRLMGVLTTIAMLSGDRGVSSGGVLMGSALLTGIPLAYISDIEPTIFFSASGLLLVYSLHHLRKLLR